MLARWGGDSPLLVRGFHSLPLPGHQHCSNRPRKPHQLTTGNGFAYLPSPSSLSTQLPRIPRAELSAAPSAQCSLLAHHVHLRGFSDHLHAKNNTHPWKRRTLVLHQAPAALPRDTKSVCRSMRWQISACIWSSEASLTSYLGHASASCTRSSATAGGFWQFNGQISGNTLTFLTL